VRPAQYSDPNAIVSSEPVLMDPYDDQVLIPNYGVIKIQSPNPRWIFDPANGQKS